ncbi:MAG: class I SAM-dependent methyltransferase [Steroidobacteraceae bacterium]|jgi:ubiquinone/menaquinone biosynthesis C-methylase UbiE
MPQGQLGVHPKDHFSAIAGRYAEFRPRYPAALYRWLASQAPGTARVWDCACGSGQAAVDLAEYFAHVVATDLSAQQLQEAPAHPRIEYRVALAEHSQLPTGELDLVTVAQALHWFDCERFYAEARRVLRPGGVLAVWSYAVCTLESSAADALLQDFYAATVGPYWPPERRHVESGYQTLPFPQPELLVPEFAMQLRWSLEQLVGYLGSWSATSRYIKARGEDPVPALRAALQAHWPAGDGLMRIMWPLKLRAVRLNAS